MNCGSDLEAVYGRTEVGQRELIDPSGKLSPREMSLLSAVTGFTPLRILSDLGFAAPPEAIQKLQTNRLIELQPDVRA